MHANDLDDAVTLLAGSLDTLQAEGLVGPYDVIASNILAPAHLKNLADGLADMVPKGGSILLGGFDGAAVAGLSSSLEAHGVDAVRVARYGPWAVIVGRKA